MRNDQIFRGSTVGYKEIFCPKDRVYIKLQGMSVSNAMVLASAQSHPLTSVSSSMKLNIREIQREIQEKKIKKLYAYDSVLEKCHKKIIENVRKDILQMFFLIPEFVFEIPSYDIKICTVYLIKNLRENGFYVKYYYPKFLYISWDPAQLEKISHRTNTRTIVTGGGGGVGNDSPRHLENSNTTRTIAFPFKAPTTSKSSGKYVLHL